MHKLLIAGLIFSVAISVQAGERVVDFSATGVVVNIQTFYSAIETKPESILFENTAGKALVVDDQVYAFLESPANDAALKDVKPGSGVVVTGKLLVASHLLHIDALVPAPDAAADVSGLRKAAGKKVSISGKNMCQCGLAVSTLPHSCKLGHIHHLQALDGTIYHYLQSSEEHALNRNHFKAMSVDALLFPGNWIYVTAVK